jgi:hypothetical protein
MDERVFGPYYGMPPEQRTGTSRTEQVFQQPPVPVRRTLRQRLIEGRRRRPPIRTRHTVTCCRGCCPAVTTTENLLQVTPHGI